MPRILCSSFIFNTDLFVFTVVDVDDDDVGVDDDDDDVVVVVVNNDD